MGNVKVLTGNYSAAEAAALCRLDLIAAYPITPQSSVVEHLAELVHNGEIDASLVQVESEHSAMSVVQGAAAGGGRVFTATSAQGLALMYEPYFRMSTLRLPILHQNRPRRQRIQCERIVRIQNCMVKRRCRQKTIHFFLSWKIHSLCQMGTIESIVANIHRQ